MSRHHRFQNWSKTVEFRVEDFVRPRNEDQVVEAVRHARAEGRCLRVQGSGHSFSQIVTTSDVLVSLECQDSLFSWNGNEVTVHAGMQLKDLIRALKRMPTPLALANMGSVTEQTIAGAISTGTHGTGIGYAAMPSQVRSVTFVDGTGTVRTVDGGEAERLSAARLSLGILGVITQLTLECVPYYEVDYDIYICNLEEVLDGLDELVDAQDRVLLWWRVPFLPSEKVVVVTKNNVGTDRALPMAARPIDALDRASEIMPGALGDLVGILARSDLGTGCRHIVSRRGGYEDMLTIPLLPVYHRECEYAIPRASAAEAIRHLDRIFDEGDVDLRLPVEVRFVKGDADLINPARDRDVCYIGAATLDNATEVFERFEPVMKDLEGRPHWGKHFNLRRSEVEAMYGAGYTRFVELREEYDPDRIFLNTLLLRLFG